MGKRSAPAGFVAYACERLRDGLDECARLFDTEAQAVAWIGKRANGYAGCNTTFRLFRLGAEVPLDEITEAEVVPPKTRRVFRARPAKE